MNQLNINHLVYQFLCFLMAIHVINISIDTPDGASLAGRGTAYHKDLSVNDIDSIGEFILESCLGITDAVPEHDDSDDESEFAGLEQDYLFSHPFVLMPPIPSIHYLSMVLLPFRSGFSPTPVTEIIAPPPQLTV